MKEVFKALLVVIVFAAVLILPALAMTYSQSGSRWLLALIPDLEVEGFDGRLADDWQAQRINWADQIILEQVSFKWQIGCLLKASVCIDQLSAKSLRIELAAGSESREPFTGLNDLELPVSVSIQQLELNELIVSGQRISEIELVAQSNGTALNLEHFKLRYADMLLQGQGQITTLKQWPVALDVKADFSALIDQEWALKLQAKGDLNHRLALEVDSTGYLPAQLKGWVEPLVEHLPAQLTLNSESFLATAQLPENLTLEQVELRAKGNLKNGYELVGKGQLRGDASALPLALHGRVDAAGLALEQLQVRAAEAEYLNLAGNLDWQESFAMQAQLEGQKFPWQALYPLDLEAQLEQLSAELAYNQEGYQGKLNSSLLSPLGAFSVSTQFTGNGQALALEELLLEAGDGRAQGQATINFADALSWQTELTLTELNPAHWVAELPGKLNGRLSSEGHQQASQLHWQAQAELMGRLRQQPTQLKLHAQGQGENVQISELLLQLGDNRIQGQANLAEQLAGQLQLQLPKLGQLWPELTGQAQGQVTLAGTREAPALNVQLSGKQFGYEDSRFADLSLLATLNQQGYAELNLQARNLRQDELSLGNLEIQAQGSASSHQGQLSLAGGEVGAELSFTGGMREGDWRGQLTQAQLVWQELDWRLRSATGIQRLADGRLLVGAHCWEQQNAAATLCAGEQQLAPLLALDYHLRNFDLQTLAELIDQQLQWQGELEGDLQVKLLSSGPQGSIRLEAGSGVIRSASAGPEQELRYAGFSLLSQLTPTQVDTQLQLTGQELGRLNIQVKLDPRQKDPRLNGRYEIEQLQLALAKPFLPMFSKFEGQMQGFGQIQGTLLHPQIFGELALQQAEIDGSDLPVTFEQLNVRLHFAGQHMELSGAWHSGDNGVGSISGQAHWQDEFFAEIQVKGHSLPVVIEPYAHLEADADLTLAWLDEGLKLSGTVSIPRGTIEVKEIPEGTVQISEDTYIVGSDEQESSPIKLAMSVVVNAGAERLSFSGFGLTADLKGQIRIGDNLDARGDLRLIDGRFRAYGQRLDLRQARIFFRGPLTRPYLDVEAIREVSDVVAGLRLTGPLDAPKTTIFSEPGLPQDQALSYLILGRPMGRNDDNNMLAQAALALGLAGSADITGGIARLFGVKNFEVDTQGSGLTTSVVASGQLSDRLSLRYGVGVFEPTTILALRYELTKRLYLEAASGLVSSLDVFYQRDF